MVNLPDVRGREGILKVHAKNVKLAPDVDLSIIARGTPGYSGAELANLLNEAALLAARLNKKSVGMEELEEARDKVRWGRERRSLAMTDEEKKHTAWHEAGHVLVNMLLDHTHPLHKVTIIPRGQSLGSTMQLPEKDILSRSRKEMLDDIAVTMGGRIAEEMMSGDISTGAAMDIQQATAMARAMVCQYGMSDKVGMVQYGTDDEFVFLGREMGRPKVYSESTAREIDEEIKRLIDDGYKTAQNIIVTHRDKLELIASALLEYETLDRIQVEEIISTGKFTPPPPKPTGERFWVRLPARTCRKRRRNPCRRNCPASAPPRQRRFERRCSSRHPAGCGAGVSRPAEKRLAHVHQLESFRTSFRCHRSFRGGTHALYGRRDVHRHNNSNALFQRLQILGQELGDILESRNIVRIDGHEGLVCFEAGAGDFLCIG